MIKPFDIIQTTQAHAAANGYAAVRAGQQGTVVHVYSKPTQAFEVEFCNSQGETVAMLTLTADQLVAVPAARAPRQVAQLES